MSRTGPVVRWATAVALICLGATACSESPPVATVAGSGGAALEVDPDLVPDELVGLTTEAENIEHLEKEAGPDSYLASTRLWSLREGERLRATLQIGRLVPDAGGDSPDAEEEFRLKIVAQIGQSEPRRRVLGGETVYVTVANSQPVYVWFQGRLLYVLSVDATLAAPRQLLRAALEVGR